jgi:hypothetical protein
LYSDNVPSNIDSMQNAPFLRSDVVAAGWAFDELDLVSYDG